MLQLLLQPHHCIFIARTSISGMNKIVKNAFWICKKQKFQKLNKILGSLCITNTSESNPHPPFRNVFGLPWQNKNEIIHKTDCCSAIQQRFSATAAVVQKTRSGILKKKLFSRMSWKHFPWQQPEFHVRLLQGICNIQRHNLQGVRGALVHNKKSESNPLVFKMIFF